MGKITVNEKCENPYRRCKRTDIIIAVRIKGKIRKLCSKCWDEIAEKKQW